MSAKVLFDNLISQIIRRQCRPRFSFFCIKLSKNRQSQNRRKLIPLNNPASQSLNHPNHPAQGLNLVCAPSQRCRVSKSHRSVCQPIFQEIHSLTNRSFLNTSTKPKPGQRRRHNQFKHHCQSIYVNPKDASACRLRRRRPRCGAIYVPLIKTVNAKITKISNFLSTGHIQSILPNINQPSQSDSMPGNEKGRKTQPSYEVAIY